MNLKKSSKKNLMRSLKQKFREKFDAEFQSEFDVSFNAQIKQMLMAQGLDETTAGVMLDTAVAQAKQSGQYNKAYDTAYEKAYPKAHDEAYEKAFDEAHDEAYEKAYDEAWNKVLDEINEKYADAEEKYELNDPDFKETPVHLYENFYRDEEEDHDNDGTSDGTVRVFAKTDDINFACLMDGSFPEKEDEIAIDRMHADNVGIKVGDEITVGEEKYQVVGLIAYVNYSTLHEKSTDLMFDALKFNVAMVTDEGFAKLHKTIHYDYAWKYENEPSDEKEEKNQSDDFMRALLTQTVVNDNEIEDYVPNMRIRRFILQPTTWALMRQWEVCCLYSDCHHRIYFCSYDQQYDHKRVICNRNIACVRLYERGAGTPLSVYAGYRYPDFRISRKCAWLYGI